MSMLKQIAGLEEEREKCLIYSFENVGTFALVAHRKEAFKSDMVCVGSKFGVSKENTRGN